MYKHIPINFVKQTENYKNKIKKKILQRKITIDFSSPRKRQCKTRHPTLDPFYYHFMSTCQISSNFSNGLLLMIVLFASCGQARRKAEAWKAELQHNFFMYSLSWKKKLRKKNKRK